MRFALPGARLLSLKPLTPEAAVRLVHSIYPQIGEHADLLASYCGRLPLALRVAASTLMNDDTLRVSSFLSQLADERRRLAALRDPDLPELDVRAALAMCDRTLDPAARQALRTFSILSGPFDRATASAVLAEDPDAAFTALRRRSLLERGADDEWFTLHSLVRVYAAEQTEQATRHQWFERLCAHIEASGEQARQEISASSPAAACARLDRLDACLRTALAWARDHDPHTHARLCSNLWDHWELRGALDFGRQELGAVLARGGWPPPLTAWLQLADGRLAASTGAYRIAQTQIANSLAVWEQTPGFDELAAACLNDLASVTARLGHFHEAEQHLRQALARYRRLSGRFQFALLRANFGRLALDQGRLADARRHLARAQSHRETRHDPTLASKVGLNQALLALLQDDLAEAERLVAAALEQLRALGDPQTFAEGLVVRAAVAQAGGRPTAAAADLAEAGARLRGIGDQASLAECLEELAAVAHTQGDLQLSIQRYAHAAALREQTEAPQAPRVLFTNLGSGRFTDSVEFSYDWLSKVSATQVGGGPWVRTPTGLLPARPCAR